MKRTACFSLVSCLLILGSQLSHAILDINNNGCSDRWEKTYHSGQLVDSSFDPQADSDGDGWTNIQEATAGTDPGDANPPAGCLRTSPIHIPATYITGPDGNPELLTPEAYSFTWPTKIGKYYTLAYSTDLTPDNWNPVGSTYRATTTQTTTVVSVTQEDGTRPEKLFWRVQIEDGDSDNDGLTDYEEMGMGSSMFLADSNGNGIDDGSEANNGDDPTANSGDTNNDGVPDNIYYTPVLEVNQESKSETIPSGFGSPTGQNSRYLSKTERYTYSVSNSPTLDSVTNGEKKITSSYLAANTGLITNQKTVTETGLDYSAWADQHTHPFSSDPLEYLEDGGTTTFPPAVVITTASFRETTTTTISTTPWQIKRAPAPHLVDSNTNPVVRSGTEIITRQTITKQYDSKTYEDVWKEIIPNSPWDEFIYPDTQGPLLQIDQVLGAVTEAEGAEIVRESFRLGLGAMAGIIASPSGGEAGGGDKRLEKIRWRWARFNPLDPFNYDYVAPPATYQKQFKLYVRKANQTSTPQTNLETETSAIGVVTAQFSGNQGSGWTDLPLQQLNSFKTDEPKNLPNIGYNGNAATTTISFSNVPVKIAFDGNRNGKIDVGGLDNTTLAKPYRFWINNDQDDVEQDEPVIVDENARDLLDEQIKTKRDLEDFARLKIQLSWASRLLARGEFKLGLKFKNITEGSPQIRVWKNPHVLAEDYYLRYGNYAQYYLSQTPLSPNMDGMIIFPQSFWADTEPFAQELIFEGTRKGKGELIAVLLTNAGNELGQSEGQALHLLDVKEMYQRARVQNTAEQIPNPWVNHNPPAQTWAWDPNGNPPVEDPNAEPITAIFVHGWRLKYNDYINWSDTSFKRLWHQGYKGKFYSFRWATFSGDNNGILPYGYDEIIEGTAFPPGGTTYNASEYRAWLCGPTLASFVNQLPNAGKRSLFAHSMGNVITGSALRSGMSIQQYAMCNAAMAAMAYDPNPALKNVDQIFIAGTLPELQDTPDTDPDPAIRVGYGLENKFNLPGMPEVFNFGLPDDSALGSWSANNLFFKPNTQYFYTENSILQPFPLVYQVTPVSSFRSVTALPEAMGYVTKSRTRAAGADLRTSESVNIGSQNMNDWGAGASHAGFGFTHSAQWRWNNQSTHLFWRKLTAVLQLQPVQP